MSRPAPNQSGLLAPDTSGMNFYGADPALIDHRVSPGDSFRLVENTVQDAIAGHVLVDRVVVMAKVGELLPAA